MNKKAGIALTLTGLTATSLISLSVINKTIIQLATFEK